MTEQMPKRTYEGPPRLVNPGIQERQLREEGRGIPKSYARHLNDTYGPEGEGWEFTPAAYEGENQIKDELHAPEFALATEAMRNYIAGRGYVLDNGTDMTGKVQRYTRNSDKGDVVVYPDGDIHAHEKEEQK